MSKEHILLERLHDGVLSTSERANLARQLQDDPEWLQRLARERIMIRRLSSLLAERDPAIVAKQQQQMRIASRSSRILRLVSEVQQRSWSRRQSRSAWRSGALRRWLPLTAAVLVLGLFSGWLVSEAKPAAAAFARLNRVSHNVVILRDGHRGEVIEGMELRSGDRLQVADGGFAEIAYADRSTLHVASATDLRLWAEGGAKRLILDHGELHGTIAQQISGKSMKLSTELAEVEIDASNTRFVLRSEGAKTRLEVVEGVVELRRIAADTSERVHAGGVAEVVARYSPVTHTPVSSIASTIPAGFSLAFAENFEDTAFASRNWYDNIGLKLSATEHAPGSNHSAEFHWRRGAKLPDSGGPMRKLFTATERVYVSYWIKYGADDSFPSMPHHELCLLSNEDDDFVGPGATHLSVYIEQREGRPQLTISDGLNIDTARVDQDLTVVTEFRAVAGGNGVFSVEQATEINAAPLPDEGVWWNSKHFTAGQVCFHDAVGPSSQTDWHRVEVVIVLNSIVDGRGRCDGYLSYRLDGESILEKDSVLFRTGAHPQMKFNQFLILPYFNDGAPTDQRFWLDDVTVATAP